MKKRILSVILVAILLFSLTGCATTTYQDVTKQTESKTSEDFGNGYFTVITKWDGYQIVYANDTKVKYLVRYAGYHFGITPLYNADGTLQIYEENED